MAEECRVSTAEDGRQRAPKRGQAGVANRENAAKDAMEASGSEAVLDCARADAELDQLPAGHHAMLAEGQLGDPDVRRLPPTAS